MAPARWVGEACGLRTRLDRDRLIALCRPFHTKTDAPYSRGRLAITPLGEGRFRFAMV